MLCIFASIFVAPQIILAAVSSIVLDFEGLNPPPYLYTLAHVGTSYTSSYGVTFSPNDTSIIPGVSAGGNWGMDGTAGTTFMGFNGSNWSGADQPMTVTFAIPWNAFSMDIAHSNGAPSWHNLGFYESWLDVTAFLGANQVYQGKAYLDNPNVWSTFSFGGVTFDKITWQVNDTSGGLSSGNYLPYGVDKITNVPEPSTLTLIYSASGILAIVRRSLSRRQPNHSPLSNLGKF